MSTLCFQMNVYMSTLCFQMVLVVIFIIAVIMYRVLISIPLFQNKWTRSQAQTIASMSAAVVNLILIMALGKVYEKLALKLTQWGKIYHIFLNLYKLFSLILFNISIMLCTDLFLSFLQPFLSYFFQSFSYIF